jgi:beta-glucanase (GH16 family)
MRKSADPTHYADGTSAGGETIVAPKGPSGLSGDGGGDTLVGSSGDNTFWVTDPHDKIDVADGQSGIKTAIAYTSYTLPDNVQNLIVHDDYNYAVGNDQDNLIRVTGSQWIDGRAGDDVMVGGAGRTTFVVHTGNGSDVIYNWQDGDQVQLKGAGFKTFADIKDAMKQVGHDVVLQIDSSETLTFRGVTISDFGKSAFLVPFDKSKIGALTFHDEFNSLNLYNPSSGNGVWQTNFGGNLKDVWAYNLVSNGETQAYVTPDFRGQGNHPLGYNPLSVKNGVLTITAQPFANADDSQAAYFQRYASGMINTMGTFKQQYGYFEMRAELPEVAGTWPAFWMEPDPWVPNVEADIMEALGADPKIDYRRAFGGNETQFDDTYRGDPGGYHTYGMLWTKTTVTFYYDGIEVLKGPTPSTWTQPLVLIANLAVGGWGGEADSADFPAKLKIDYIRAYALADGSSVVVHPTPETPAATIRTITGHVKSTAAAADVQMQTFDSAGHDPVTASKIQFVQSKPDPKHLPAADTMFVWEDSGAVFGAESHNGKLSAAKTLIAGTLDQFVTGTWLSDGKVALIYAKHDHGETSYWSIVFNSTKNNIYSEQELGTGTGKVHIVALADGGFAVSWHDGSTILARAYDAHAYDGKGWYGPLRHLAGDLIGENDKGQLIVSLADDPSHRKIYDIISPQDTTPSSISIGPKLLSHHEGDSGLVAYKFTVTRSWNLTDTSTVHWSVEGDFKHPASADDFKDGVLPSGTLTFAPGQSEKTITVYVQGDKIAETDETFTVSLTQVSGAILGRAVVTGAIVNDDGSATSAAQPAQQHQTEMAPLPPDDEGMHEQAMAADAGFMDALTHSLTSHAMPDEWLCFH